MFGSGIVLVEKERLNVNWMVKCIRCRKEIGTMSTSILKEAVIFAQDKGGVMCPLCRAGSCEECGTELVTSVLGNVHCSSCVSPLDLWEEFSDPSRFGEYSLTEEVTPLSSSSNLNKISNNCDCGQSQGQAWQKCCEAFYPFQLHAVRCECERCTRKKEAYAKGGGKKCQSLTVFTDADIVNAIYPISSVVIYEAGVMQLKRSNLMKKNYNNPHGKRAEIKKLSRSALSRLAFVVAANNSTFRSLLTLTYGVQFPLSGRQVKSDLNRFLTSFKREYPNLLYVWFLEFQTRGAPHFHFFLSLSEPTNIDRRTMAVCWTNAQRLPDCEYSRLKDRKMFHVKQSVFKFHKEQERVWEKIKHPEGAKRYALKYALKPHQKIVPMQYRNVGRFWGCSRELSNPVGLEIEVSRQDIETYLADVSHRCEGWDVLPKYLW